MAIRKFLRCRTNEMLKLWGASSNEEMGWMNQWTNESTNQKMNQWVNEPLSEWINESVWMSEWVSRRTNESANQWTNESLIKIPLTCSLGCFTKHFLEKIGYRMVLRQPTSRQQVGTLYEMTSPSSLWNASPQTMRVQRHAARHRATTQLSSIKCCTNLGFVQWLNQWICESMSPWFNESMNQWRKGWVGEWMDGWASYFFVVEILLHSPTFLLKHLFSQLLLLWAATYLGYLPWAASQLAVASATKVFSLCSCCNAFCSLQLQSHIAQEQHYGQGLPFAQLLQCV